MPDFREYKALSLEEQRYLQHFGILGMKWGQRKDPADRKARKDALYRAQMDRKVAKSRARIEKVAAAPKTPREDIIRKRELAIASVWKNPKYEKDLGKLQTLVNKCYNDAGDYYPGPEEDSVISMVRQLDKKVKADPEYQKPLPEFSNADYQVNITGMSWNSNKGRVYVDTSFKDLKSGSNVSVLDLLKDNIKHSDDLDALAHYGVLGMHWGKRKAESGVSPSTRGEKKTAKLADKAERTTPSDDSKRTTKIQRKKLAAMTNQELRTVNERLQLEQTYRNLNPKKRSLGKKYSDSILGKQVNTSAKSYVSQTAAALVKAAVFV